MSARRALALGCVCLGVGAAVVNDLSISAGGFLASLCWVPVAALYKVLWSRVAKEEAWHTLALMRRVLPLSTGILLALMPLIDPPGLGEYRWTPREGRSSASPASPPSLSTGRASSSWAASPR